MARETRLRRLLLDAQNANRLVVVTRRLKYSDRSCGFVVGIGTKWALLQLADDAGGFDGYIAIRIRDVAAVKPDKTFATRAAPELPHWPPSAPATDFDLDSTRGLLVSFSVASESGLIAIEKERERYAQWIGTFDEIIGKYVYLLEVHPSGKWHRQPLGYKIRDITSIAIGGLYRNALARYVDWSAKPRNPNEDSGT